MMKESCFVSALTVFFILGVFGISEASTINNFAISTDTYSVFGDTEAIIDNLFGEDYRLADWNDIVEYYNEGNDMEAFTSLILGRTMVSRNGDEFWSSNRHYFINISNHNTPSGFLVHAHIDNHLIDLGSWYNDRYILAYTDNPVPIPAQVTFHFLQCPCEVTFFDMYLDGGTLGGKLKDSTGKVLKFCRDGRMRIHCIDGKKQEVEPWKFYIGATHPTDEGAIALEIGGEDEAHLIALLRSWIKTAISEELLFMLAPQYDAAPTFKEKQEIISSNELSDVQVRALWVNQMIERHEARNMTGQKNK